MKKLALLASLTCLATSAFAHDVTTELKLNGIFDFQAGGRNQTKLDSSEKNISQNNKNLAFYTSAAFCADIAKTSDELTYGGRITLVPTTKAKGSPSYNGSKLFVESNVGKVEIGSMMDPASTMRLSGFDVAVAAPDGWSRYAVISPKKNAYKGQESTFSDSAEYFFDSFFVASNTTIIDGTEQSRKISYYTPKIQGFQFGIGYTPDSQNTGIEKQNKANKTGIDTITLDDNVTTIEINKNVKDAVCVGLSYEHNLSDGVDLQVSATGEYGKPAGRIIEKVKNGDNLVEKSSHKLKNLNTYSFGAILNYGNFSYGASYGSFNKSLTNKFYHKNGRNINYYNAAVAYKFGSMSTSLAYFKSGQYKNNLDAVSVGTEYNIAPGLVPYAQLTYFQAKGKPVFYPEAPKKKSRGTVALIGAKLKL